MLKIFQLILAAAVMLVACGALAQTVYRWVDEEGEVHYGHAVPPEHAGRGYEVLGRDGVVRERVEPALTPEQAAERREQRRREAELAAQRRTQETRDRMLLANYDSEDAIYSALEMQLVSINSQRSSIRIALEQVEYRFERLLAQAAEYSEEGRPVPASLEQSLEQSRRELRRLRGDLSALNEREEAARQRHQADLERFRQLTNSRQ